MLSTATVSAYAGGSKSRVTGVASTRVVDDSVVVEVDVDDGLDMMVRAKSGGFGKHQVAL